MATWKVGRWPLLVLAWAMSCDAAPEEVATTDDGPAGPVGQTDGDDTESPPGAEEACADLGGACGSAGVCDAYPCGGRAARFNHFGCRRYACESDDDCPDAEACFTLVYDTVCEPAQTSCGEEEGACVCTSTDDCEGTSDAHCLPTQFYPPSEYCDVVARSCDELPSWLDALENAEADHRARQNVALAEGLAACVVEAKAASEACP